MNINRSLRVPLLLLASSLIAGCATFSKDGGFDAVSSTAKNRLGKEVKWVKNDNDADSVRQTVEGLLKKPLSVDDAVQIALLNNPGLQASYAELGIAEADMVRASRLPNPGFSFARLRRGDEIEIERAFTFNIASLLAIPFASKIEGRRFEQTKLSASSEMLTLAAKTRKAYYRAVAAQEAASYSMQVKETADASAQLAQRMVKAGNWSKLEQAREQIFYAEATATLARAQQTALSEREQLTRLMGLHGKDAQFKLAEHLPELPKTVREVSDIEKMALSQRLDVQMAKRDTEAVASSLGLTKATRFINVLELGYHRNSETDKPVQTGYEISFELPLFDFGTSRVAKAEAVYMQSLNHTAQTLVNARSEAREAYAGYRTSYDIAKHYRDEIVPLRKRISEENLLRYNGMLLSVFHLLADAREQIGTVNSYIESLRDFWLAESDLEAALTSKLDMSEKSGTPEGSRNTGSPSAAGH